ncbi:helix-turn-helix transcriptional regulator [Capnocytophaga genosp. AHN8471]|uniref:helix-turn-helix domain-containing protein n=1 Tax=Capnocytophaga genosp. AHN8471 TaxID=327574 RepID=UPI0019342E6B|nr:helix-turn-helix transcriptional regulator [Capnocytophaga genosp. AHN8471]MBM0656331.1 helix-turn-helix transcriptional regulator [Capnocytophaga genosp. AHN8471]
MEVEKILEKITQKRSQKGYTYENMADDLGLTPSGYRKIEKGETKLSVEKMFQISTVLDIPINELLDIGENWIQNNSYNKDSSISAQKIEHFYQENKEMLEKLIASYEARLKDKEEQIELLKIFISNSKL